MASKLESTDVEEDICFRLDEAQKAILVLKETIDEKATKLDKDKSHFVTMSKKLDDIHFTKHIKLNIGGKIFKTSLETLCKDPESMFASMFSERYDVQPDEDDGAYFIDRDGTQFRYILNFLRTGELVFPKENAVVKRELILEAQFYQLKGLESAIWGGPRFTNSPALINSLTAAQKEALISFVPTPVHYQWNLLFSQNNGWYPNTFHTLCDNKGPTLVLAKYSNFVCGGYSQEPWTSNTNFVRDPNAFLFSLANYTGAEPTIIPQQNDAGGIWCTANYGPGFGSASGRSILFLNQASSSNHCTINDSYGGFQCPQGQILSTFLFGTTVVAMTNLEIFGLQSC